MKKKSPKRGGKHAVAFWLSQREVRSMDAAAKKAKTSRTGLLRKWIGA